MGKKIKVILLKPNKLAEVVEIDGSLSGMQKIVDGLIEPAYYFEDPICVIVNEEGKINGSEFNRGVYVENKLVDIIAGTAFVCGVNGCNFTDIPECMISKYMNIFKYPDAVFNINGKVVCVPIIDVE